ncbi:hypothetical protein D6856_00575 [Butyrivibrio sp. XB500-5]|uniref:hypothetical protein n=1 Tax=Butyrivibrio sp. XB500-5 TaxID=2364880 RepID=UPI000EA98B94|nr:hypothetical protein [Butyrivibrio sp. XB500-5]RKM62657.1 hypothetical protein D6856_00575 [Butyrivibrio sp. XB500-5]
MIRHRRYIDYTIYESSKLATLISAIGATALEVGIPVLLFIVVLISQGVKDDEAMIFLLVSIVLVIFGALCKFKWAEKIADNAIKNSNNQRNT